MCLLSSLRRGPGHIRMQTLCGKLCPAKRPQHRMPLSGVGCRRHRPVSASQGSAAAYVKINFCKLPVRVRIDSFFVGLFLSGQTVQLLLSFCADTAAGSHLLQRWFFLSRKNLSNSGHGFSLLDTHLLEVQFLLPLRFSCCTALKSS